MFRIFILLIFITPFASVQASPATPDWVRYSPETVECEDELTVSWEASDYRFQYGDGFQLSRRSATINETNWSAWEILYPHYTAASYIDKALDPGKKYQYRIQGAHHIGNGVLDHDEDYAYSPEIHKPNCLDGNYSRLNDGSAGSVVRQEIPEQTTWVMSFPNATAISYNKFRVFNTGGKKQRILNSTSSYATNPHGHAAKLIIIDANEININSEIELVGQKADLLLINTNDLQTIYCDTCKFTNFGRVTFATVLPEQSGSLAELIGRYYQLGDLNTLANSQIELNNLSAPGADLEFISNRVNINGAINTNVGSGDQELSQGSVSLFLSGIAVDYELGSVSRSWATEPATSYVNGEIKSASIRIYSHQPLKMNARLESLTLDENGGNQFDQERIIIETLANRSPIWIDASVISSGGVRVNSGANSVHFRGQKFLNDTITPVLEEHFSVALGDIYRSPIAISSTEVYPVYESKGQKLIRGEESDILILSSPNEHGIAFADFDRFNIGGRPLLISNVKENSEYNEAAKRIVIRSREIQLNHRIEILGEPADLLILGDVSSEIRCTRCSFRNFGRVTLANVTNSNIDLAEADTVGDLLAGGRIVLHGLDAPGIRSLELVASHIYNRDSVNTNLRGQSHANGGYEISEAGPLKIGAGGINLYVGEDIVFNYDENTIPDTSSDETLNFTLEGHYSASSVNIHSSRPMQVNAVIDVASDLLLSANYQNDFNLQNQYISIKSLAAKGGLSLNSNLKSDATITLRSSNGMTIRGNIVGRFVDVIAEGEIHSAGTISGGRIELAAESYLNTGKLEFDGKILVFADNDIKNSYGGRILADEISLTSKSATVLNGSLLPYTTNEARGRVNKEEIAGEEFGWVDGGEYHGYNENLGRSVSDLSAKITGRIVLLKGRNVKNVNPYYEYKKDAEDWESVISFQPTFTRQVMIEAGQLLVVDALLEFHNTSAILGATESDALLQIVASRAYNQRYRFQEGIRLFTDAEVLNPDGSGDSQYAISKGVETGFFVNSPPGYIYTMGKIQSGGLLFHNKASFIEVFGDAIFSSREVKSTGVVAKKATYERYVSWLLDPDRNDATHVRDYTPDTEEDTLFYVRGNADGVKFTPSEFSNMEVIEQGILESVSAKFEELIVGVKESISIIYDKLFWPGGEDEDASQSASPSDIAYSIKDKSPTRIIPGIPIEQQHEPVIPYGFSDELDSTKTPPAYKRWTQVPFEKGEIDHSHDKVRTQYVYSEDKKKYVHVFDHIDHSGDVLKVTYGRKIVDDSNKDHIKVKYEKCDASVSVSKRVKQRPIFYYRVWSKVSDRYQKLLNYSYAGFGVSIPLYLQRTDSVESIAEWVYERSAEADAWAIRTRDYNLRYQLPFYAEHHERKAFEKKRATVAEKLGVTTDHYPITSEEEQWESYPSTVFDYENVRENCVLIKEEKYDYWDAVTDYVEKFTDALQTYLDGLIDWWGNE